MRSRRTLASTRKSGLTPKPTAKNFDINDYAGNITVYKVDQILQFDPTNMKSATAIVENSNTSQINVDMTSLKTELFRTKANYDLRFNVKLSNDDNDDDDDNTNEKIYGIGFLFLINDKKTKYDVIMYCNTNENQIQVPLESSLSFNLNDSFFLFGENAYSSLTINHPIVSIEYNDYLQILLNNMPFGLQRILGDFTFSNVLSIVSYDYNETTGSCYLN
ncbi:hypothetical protein CL6EHI_125500 [Entamoeba histolytica]|uniref:Uncharacterized protein n=2 Tax=Entamoeba histolytica TaxID=5759 RepID=B1N5J4_ENTH1|nr:hypothetical protein EHI_125500 [Entamoeba histolytica HM-1:IMSS]EDS88764.1 hypothetical protein EHI_125500 [Entamoeba histolytica HM-1:IMSS]GAT99533.1 hypothetical protein CL6EHI_125500 [Entamoeba histolytica]|eukprot:XP_001914460.1 hypothetical protein EHI_125500 [Entamoeba histolytica HM-1:IMSS]